MMGSRCNAIDMDGANAPALFSGSRETVWAALPSRPAAFRRNPAIPREPIGVSRVVVQFRSLEIINLTKETDYGYLAYR